MATAAAAAPGPRPGTCGHFVELRAVRRSLIVEAACWVIHMPLDRRRDLVIVEAGDARRLLDPLLKDAEERVARGRVARVHDVVQVCHADQGEHLMVVKGRVYVPKQDEGCRRGGEWMSSVIEVPSCRSHFSTLRAVAEERGKSAQASARRGCAGAGRADP